MTDIVTELNCRWDPDDPSLCFEADACGCFVDPCDYFSLTADQCGAHAPDADAWVYIEVCPIHPDGPDPS